MEFKHSSKNHSDAEDDVYFVDWTEGARKGTFGAVSREVAEAIVGEPALPAGLNHALESCRLIGRREIRNELMQRHLLLSVIRSYALDGDGNLDRIKELLAANEHLF